LKYRLLPCVDVNENHARQIAEQISVTVCRQRRTRLCH